MRFVTVRELRNRSAAIWQELEQEREMVVTNNGRPIGILLHTDEDHFEQTLRQLRRARAQDAVRRLQLRSVEQGKNRQFNADEIDQEIDDVRMRRHR